MRVLTPCLVGLLFGMQESLAQAGAVPAGGKDAAIVAFVNVALVSMQDGAVRQGHTVVIQGERIGSAGPVDAMSGPSGAMVIDASGRHLMPGLADMHVHVRVPFANGPLFLNAGITTVLRLGTRSGERAAPSRQRRGGSSRGVAPSSLQ